MVGFGTILAWILTYTLVGPYLALAPELRLRRATPAGESLEHRPRWHEIWVSRFVDQVARHKLPIVAGVFLLSLGAVGLSMNNTINANPFRYFDETFWLRQSADFAEAHLRGSQGIEVVVSSGRADGVKDPGFLQRVEKFQNWLDEQEYVAKTVSIIDFLKQSNRALHGDDPAFYTLPPTQQEISELLFLYSVNLPEGLDLSNRVSLEADKLRISVRWTLYDSAIATKTADQLERMAKTLGLDIETTGKMLLFQRMNSYVAQSLLISLSISLLLISAILMVVFRSVRMGIVSLLGNVMPLGVGVAVLTLVGRDIDTGAVVALSVCLGVVIDDTIHLLQAIQSSGARSMREAISCGISRVLAPTSLTTVILVIGFGAFMMGDFVPNQNFGLLAVAICLSGYLFDLIFLPALLLVLSQRSDTQWVPLEAESRA
jgi:predicted RND superfamily exporter protein